MGAVEVKAKGSYGRTGRPAMMIETYQARRVASVYEN
jgi:hypothetical protein